MEDYVILVNAQNEIVGVEEKIKAHISAAVPQELSDFIKKAVTEHGNKKPVAVRRIIRTLAERHKVDPSRIATQHLQSYFDDLKRGVTS